MLGFQPRSGADGGVDVRAPDGQRYPIESPGLAAFLESMSPESMSPESMSPELRTAESFAAVTPNRTIGTQRSRFTLTDSPVPQTDVRPLSLISLQTVARLSAEMGQSLDPRRFRANLILDLPGGPGEADFPEDALVGRMLQLGREAVILVQERDPRCRFVTYDPGAPMETEPLFGLMKLLDRKHQGRAGVYATVLQQGPIACGDAVWPAVQRDRTRQVV